LLKFPDVPRENALKMAADFKKYDSRGTGELQEDEAMRLLEARGETKRFVELRQMVRDMDYDQNRELSMLEWACAYYTKSWQELHNPSANQAEIDAAMAKLRHAQEREIATAEEARRKAAAERARVEALEQAKIEAEQRRNHETKQAGIKGAAAKFHYAATDTKDQTKDNAAKIKAEAAARAEAKRMEKEQKLAEEERARAAEELKNAEEGSAERQKQKQEEMKRQAEEAEKQAAIAEAERKRRVQANLAAKFGTKG